MSEKVSIELEKSTIEALRSYVRDFDVSIDDVIIDVLKQNEQMRVEAPEKSKVPEALDEHHYAGYDIYKLPQGRILVTKDQKKVSNMKKVLLEAGEKAGMPQHELDSNFTTYEIGRFLFRQLRG